MLQKALFTDSDWAPIRRLGAQEVVPGCRYISQLTSDKSTILGQERMEV